MKKNILVAASLAFCATLGSVTSVAATDIIDQRFPKFGVLPLIIRPSDNGVEFALNKTTTSGHIKSFATFVSDTGHNLADLKESYPILPTGIASPVVFVEVQKDDNLVLSTETTSSIIAVMASESSNILYYAFEFWDGVVEVQRVDYQNCIDEAGGKFTGLECRLSKYSDDPVYKAYVNGTEVVPEQNSDTLAPTDDSANDEPSGNTEPQNTPDANLSDKVDDTVENSYSNAIESVNRAGQQAQSGAITNSSSKNVKNTKTDTEDTLPVTPISNPIDTTPPSNASTVSGSVTQTVSKDGHYAWWALIPISLLVISFLGWFLIGAAKKRKARQKSNSTSGLCYTE